MAPVEIVEYVLIHELAHLRVPDHSPAFWELVAEHDPAYESHAEWLTRTVRGWCSLRRTTEVLVESIFSRT